MRITETYDLWKLILSAEGIHADEISSNEWVKTALAIIQRTAESLIDGSIILPYLQQVIKMKRRHETLQLVGSFDVNILTYPLYFCFFGLF